MAVTVVVTIVAAAVKVQQLRFKLPFCPACVMMISAQSVEMRWLLLADGRRLWVSA
jgi:hypothetical protein